MQTVKKLSVDDVENIIKEYFEEEGEVVDIIIRVEAITKGYGMAEHDEDEFTGIDVVLEKKKISNTNPHQDRLNSI